MTATAPTIRRATAADARSMARVAEEAYTPYLERMGGQRPGPMDADYDALVADTEAWVAEELGTVVGFLVLVDEGDHLLLAGVAVSPSYQGRGIGRDLLVLAEERARRAGHFRLRLYTHETMVENQQLYERNGYVETHRSHEHGFSRVFYEKALAPVPFEVYRPGVHLHGTKADLAVGDLLVAGRESNFESGRVMNHVYFTATLDAAVWGAELAAGEGRGRIYLVEPTGAFEDDPNVTDKRFPGNPTQSFRSRDPLRVLGELVGWVGHPPERLQAMRSGLEALTREGAAEIED